MSVAWDEEQLLFLHRLYGSGMATQAIAAECTKWFHTEVSKNAVVGKVHRLAKLYPFGGWDPRPSPIIRLAPSELASRGPPSAALPLPSSTLPPLPSSLVSPPKPFVDRPPAFLPQASAAPPPAPTPAFSPPPRSQKIQCQATSEEPRVRRRDGTGCLYPLGDPGSQRFHYCDCDLYNLTKPYCADHAKLSYAKDPVRAREQRLEQQIDD
jgi:hypothetical protein